MRTGILIYDAVLIALVVAVVWGRRNRAKYALLAWLGEDLVVGVAGIVGREVALRPEANLAAIPRYDCH
jgi:hypothetical protein